MKYLPLPLGMPHKSSSEYTQEKQSGHSLKLDFENTLSVQKGKLLNGRKLTPGQDFEVQTQVLSSKLAFEHLNTFSYLFAHDDFKGFHFDAHNFLRLRSIPMHLFP